MNLQAHFIQWFEYDLYANLKVLETIEQHLGGLPDDTLKLFSHIIASHHIWNSRILNRANTLVVWERIPVSEMKNCIQNNFNESLECFKKNTEDLSIDYSNTLGQKYSNSISDIAFHLLTHNHYHRGQIARNMRENGIEPAETNYIVFKR